MLDFTIEGHGSYRIAHPESIATPRLLVFQEHLDANIATMRAILEEAVPGSGFSRLCPHVKTNKSSFIIKRLLEAGVTDLKASMNEAEIAAASGARRVFIAYPLLDHDAARAADLMRRYPETEITVQAGSPAHVTILERAAKRHGVTWNVMLDLDVGMHRTGARPDDAWTLFEAVRGADGLSFAGLHGYDGHIHQKTAIERSAASALAMNYLLGTVELFRGKGISVDRVIASGSPAFTHDLTYLAANAPGDINVQVSPGTWIFWDSKYDGLIPGLFRFAAVILAQVIEASRNDRITLNLGHKRWAADQGPVERFLPEGLRVALFSEEHTVLEHAAGERFEEGDYVLIVPRHICPTVNLYEFFTLIGGDGEIADAAVPVDGRNR
ncbi:alanine racemase [bacterium]|nr:alanine racemase [bacterium]